MIFVGRHFFSFGAYGIFYMSRNLVFGFTSSKSHSLPLLLNALELQRTFFSILLSFNLSMCVLSLLCKTGTADFLYFSVWHMLTLKCSLFLTKCEFSEGFGGNMSLLVGCLVDLIANLRLLFSFLVYSISRPHISNT